MKWFRRISVFLFLSLFFWGSERFVHQITEGFTLLNIQDHYPFDPKWEPSKIQPCWEKIRSIFDQKFFFLKSGGQTYAFMSEDKNYVLKITKYKRMRIPIWIKSTPLPFFLDSFRQQKIEKKKKLLDATFSSYLIAFDYLYDFSGIIYLHLNQTDSLQKKIHIVDRLGIEHPIDLDQYAFILQKRGEPTFYYFDYLMSCGQKDKAIEMLKKIARYVAYRICLCIEDHDIGFGMNFGILDDKPFQLDLGSLRFNPSFTNEINFGKKLDESLADLEKWLTSAHPSLTSPLQEVIEDLKKERKQGPISFYSSVSL